MAFFLKLTRCLDMYVGTNAQNTAALHQEGGNCWDLSRRPPCREYTLIALACISKDASSLYIGHLSTTSASVPSPKLASHNCCEPTRILSPVLRLGWCGFLQSRESLSTGDRIG